MRKVTAQRWRLTLILALGSLFALGSFWLVQLVNQSGRQSAAEQHRNEPDYIIDHFSFVRLTPAGQPSYIIAGDKLIHHPADDSSEITRPTVHSLSAQQAPLTMRAERALADQGNSRVQLNGNVEVQRPATASASALRLTTPALTVYPDEDRMETTQPVEMQLGASSASGIGMQANNATRQLQLGGRGLITLPPRAPH